MKFNLVTVILFSAGVLLIYSGIKNTDPRDVLKEALKGKTVKGKSDVTPMVPITPMTPPSRIPMGVPVVSV